MGAEPGPTLVLASASPARLATLRSAGLDPVVEVSGFDEASTGISEPEALVAALARAKAEEVCHRLGPEPGTLILGCDSVLDVDGVVHGKPTDLDQARRRWQGLSGRSALLRTGHHLILAGEPQRSRTAVSTTVVHFAEVSQAEIEAYLATGEPLAVAGAFTIDGFGGAFIAGVEGDPHGVVGVSLPLLRRLATGLGVFWPSLWQ